MNYIFWNWSKFTTALCRCSCIGITITCYQIYSAIFSNWILKNTLTVRDNIAIIMYPFVVWLKQLRILDILEFNVTLYLECIWATVLPRIAIRKLSKKYCQPKKIGILTFDSVINLTCSDMQGLLICSDCWSLNWLLCIGVFRAVCVLC